MGPPANAKKVYRSWSPQVVTGGEWTSESVGIAVRMHEMGNFTMSAQLIDAMGRDDRIVSALDTLILGVLRLDFRIAPANDTEEAARCRTAIALFWPRVFTVSKLYDALLWLIMGGFALVELDWNSDDAEAWTIDRIHVWHLGAITWDATRRLLIVQTTDGPIEVDPENLGAKWMLITAGGDRPWMRGAVRSMGDDFVAHDETNRDWSRHSEVHGGGIMKAHVPVGIGDDDDKRAFVESVADMGSDPVVECPKNADGEGYDLSLLETGKDHAAGFSLRIDRVIANINVRILGQNASTENSGPYVAKGGLFAKVTLDRIDGVVGPLELSMREHVARPFAEFNHGDPELAPIFDYDSEPPQDKAAQAQTMTQVATAVATLKTAGAAVDYAELSKRFGFKLDAAADSAVGADFFAYDLEQGTITINEYRRLAKGMEPVPWGDQTAPERKAQLEAAAAVAPAAKPVPAPEEGAAA
jgi:hypothetical protein